MKVLKSIICVPVGIGHNLGATHLDTPVDTPEVEILHCPFCHHKDSRVVDSRTVDDGLAIRRRRECLECKERFTTTETAAMLVRKRSGVMETFSKEKIVSGLAKACQGRPVSDANLAMLAQGVEEKLRQSGSAVIDSGDVGKAILPLLSELDLVAYMRFASVYLDFCSLEDFEKEIMQLRK